MNTIRHYPATNKHTHSKSISEELKTYYWGLINLKES